MKAIINGKIILKDQIAENSVLLFDNKIEGVFPADQLPADAEIIDAKGGFVAPGLIDLHIHGYLGKDVCDGEEDSIRTMAQGLVANGVTGFLPTTMTEDMAVIRKALNVCRSLKEQIKTWQGSTILGCHAEGPFISESKKGAQDAKYILKPDAAFVKEFADIISIITLAPETDTEDFDKRVKNMYIDVAKEIGENIPIEVANDGDVTALAGAMDLNDNSVLGVAMGTSEAGGYVDPQGNITGWLNELAFVPVDYCADAMVDEWSGDFGCGVKYFSQDGVIKLAPFAGIELDEKLSPAEKLKVVQNLMKDGDERAAAIYDTIGAYFGYAIAFYTEFYDIKHVLIMGRVTSGEGGVILLERAQEVLDKEFPELAKKITLHIPDENSRRVGQSVAAASLPKLN